MVYLNKKPEIDSTVFTCQGAQIIGDVRILKNASIWYNVVLRADINYIHIGERTNIQDGTVVHLDHDKPCIIGNDVTVGHNAILHACVIEDGCLIGMGAIILSGAVIKKGSIIAAGALIKENAIIESYSLMAGLPAKKVREDVNFYEKNLKHAENYVKLVEEYKKLNYPKFGS